MFEDAPMTPEQRKRELDNIANGPLLQSLRDNIRTEVARDLHRFRAHEKEFSEIESEDLLLIYLNWKYRQIHPHPRTVVYSAELSERIRTNDALYAGVKSQFNELTRIITNGGRSAFPPEFLFTGTKFVEVASHFSSDIIAEGLQQRVISNVFQLSLSVVRESSEGP